MKITRKEFLNVAAGAATLAAIPGSGTLAAACAQPAPIGKIKRGVSLFGYAYVYGWYMTLEDFFAEMYGMGATGVEILSSHVPNYPNPTDEWIEWWWSMMDKYELTPVDFGHWVDSRMYPGRLLTTQESYDSLARDLRLAQKLGFTRTRTKIGVMDEILTPVPNWREFIEMALPVAEECNIKMCTEIHQPTLLTDPFLFDDYIEFIERTGTKNFGFNVDFGVFMNRRVEGSTSTSELRFSPPEDIIPLLPYTYCCHAKFRNMSEDCKEETTTPYPEIIKVMQDNNWEGYLISEYQGQNREVPGYTSDQHRRQHVMLKNLLGE